MPWSRFGWVVCWLVEGEGKEMGAMPFAIEASST